MNREEAIAKIQGLLDDPIVRGGVAFVDQPTLRSIQEVLSGPVPDPETGLVPCGCGGKPEYYDHPLQDWVAVECVECGDNTSYKDTKEQARDVWNLSHGYI